MSRNRGTAEILSTDSKEQFEAAACRAAELLQAGELVALPTETVYGLAANALNPDAVARIFEVKGRPAHNPIIVHVASLEMARRCTAVWPDVATRLAKAFWPGPLTLVLPRSAEVPDIVTAGGTTVGVRWPRHPLVEEVIRLCGFPLAAPSANLSCRLSPTTAGHVQSQLGNEIRLIVDGGPAHVGIESTVLDISSPKPRVLRPGMIHEEALLSVVGQLSVETATEETVLRSPGLLKKHYSPRAPLVVWSWGNERELKARLSSANVNAVAVFVLAYGQVPSGSGLGGVSVIPRDPEAFARALYAELHRCDQAGAELIVVEAPPEDLEWKGIRDRLHRAASLE